MRVLITGGNGYIGRGIMRRNRLSELGWDITSMSRDESKIIRVNGMFPETHTIKGDVTEDVDILAKIFRGHDVVLHAGANKLVDVGEHSALEVVKNNVIGSQHVLYAAIKAGVKQVVGISTDKSIQAINTYGSTKFLMERMFQEADTISDTQFTCARYGNVVGSTISIVLYFEQQLRELGYIKVTNPAMTRFYMGVDEAIDTILHSMNYAQRGSVIIPKMQAMSVGDVASLVLGEEYYLGHPKTKIVGERPGEKLHESLLHEQESVRIAAVHEDQTYFELRPPIEQGCTKPFSITSDKPPLGWMTFDRMRHLIEDAKSV